MNVEVFLCSTDSPESNRKYRKRQELPFRMLSDEDHAVADRFGIPIGRLHPMARKYADGFTQPALFAYKGDEQVYSWITQPKLTNLFGAARRPTPKEVVEALQERLGSGD